MLASAIIIDYDLIPQHSAFHAPPKKRILYEAIHQHHHVTTKSLKSGKCAALPSELRWCSLALNIVGPKPDKKLRTRHQAWPDGNWYSFQLAKITPPLSVIGSDIAPFARMKN